MDRFVGKVAVVTGAARGFGRATALGFAREGASVVINYNRSAGAAGELKAEIEALGSKALVVQGDVARREDCHRIIQTAVDAFGRLDILVNNAGILDRSEFVEQDESTWEPVMAVNVWGVLHTTRAALPFMIERQYGKIVNITSQVASVGGAKSVFYSGTKGFIASMTKSLAQEMGKYGINVNAVAPGGIVTDMCLDVYPDEESRAKRAALLPVKHMGVPEDVANCVLFLCADSSNYLTGQTLHASGGFVMV